MATEKKQAQVKSPPQVDIPEEITEKPAEAIPNSDGGVVGPNNPKVQALMQFLGLTDPNEILGGHGGLLEWAGAEYLVLTDAEADARVEEEIENTLWAFNPEFLVNYMDDLLTTSDIRTLQKTRGESAGPLFKKLINGFDEFIEHALFDAGRGRYLATYDSIEDEETVDNVLYYIYRVN